MTFLPRTLNPAAHLAFLEISRLLTLCLRLLKDFKPVIVFGTGSYISFPAVLAACLKACRP